MTVDQLDQFLINRANQNIFDKNRFHDAKLILACHGSNMFLGIQFAEPHDIPFFVRYMKDNTRRLFKIDFSTQEFKAWKSSLNLNCGDPTIYTTIVEYNTAPKEVKSYVVACINNALTTLDVGIDMFTNFLVPDTNLIDANETYEEAAIEMDLAGLGAFE